MQLVGWIVEAFSRLRNINMTRQPIQSLGRQVFDIATCRLDTPVEVQYYRHGSILQAVLRKMALGEV